MNTTNNAHKRIVEQINQPEQTIEGLKAAAAAAITAYMEEVNDPFPLALRVHALFRTSNGNKYGYDSTAPEMFLYFIQLLQKHFINPKNANRFKELTEIGMDNVAEMLEKLHYFFNAMGRGKT